MKIIPINKAEAIFYPIFDKKLCDDSLLTAEHATGAREWDGIAFKGEKEFTIRWRGKLDISGYNKLICFITFAEYVKVEATAVVNGEQKKFFEGYGGNAPSEVSGLICLNNKQVELTEIVLHFSSSKEENVVMMRWFGLSIWDKEKFIEVELAKYDKHWYGLLNENRVGRLGKNVLFTDEQNEKIKKEILSNPKMLNSLRENAEKWLDIEPEKEIREFAPTGEHGYRFVRVRDRGRHLIAEGILELAIAGYIFNQAKYSQMSARMILSLIHTKWCEGPMCCMEGSDFHHVCFTEEHYIGVITSAVGFLEGIFTKEGLRKIVEKIEEAWLWVVKKCEEPGYRQFMNQGIVANKGNMLGAFFLELYKGGYEEAIHNAYNNHTRVVQNYLTDEGYCFEGLGYYEYSFASTLQLWFIYARFTGKSIDEIIPIQFKKSKNYVEAMLSSLDEKGRHIPCNCDKGNLLNMQLVLFMTALCDFKKGRYYIYNRLKTDKMNQGLNAEDMMLYVHLRTMLGELNYELEEEEEIVFKESGLASYSFREGKLVCCVEGNPLTGHFHKDRGQIILEADGEILLPDIGTTNYSNLASAFMSEQTYHNIAHPISMDMKVANDLSLRAAAEAGHTILKELEIKDMQVPTGRLLEAYKTEAGYHVSLETGILYGEDIKGKRTVDLERDHRILTVTDEWCFKVPEKLMVQYLSYGEWHVENNVATCKIGNIVVEIKFKGKSQYTLYCESNMVDWELKPVWVLRLLTSSQKKHQIVSTIKWKIID